jgi:hypothetical protein
MLRNRSDELDCVTVQRSVQLGPSTRYFPPFSFAHLACAIWLRQNSLPFGESAEPFETGTC